MHLIVYQLLGLLLKHGLLDHILGDPAHTASLLLIVIQGSVCTSLRAATNILTPYAVVFSASSLHINNIHYLFLLILSLLTYILVEGLWCLIGHLLPWLYRIKSHDL